MANRILALALVASSTLAFAPTAQAESFTHDGFFLQVGLGLGYYSSSAETMGFEQSYGGLSIPMSLMMGGTLFQQLVIGGGFFVDYAPSPGAEQNGMELDLDFSQYLVGIGAYFDYYLDPAGGLHFPFFIGWGGLETSTPEGGAGGSDPTGLMTYLGAGYDVFLSDNWSVGGQARFTLGLLSIDDTSFTTIQPSLVGTIKWH